MKGIRVFFAPAYCPPGHPALHRLGLAAQLLVRRRLGHLSAPRSLDRESLHGLQPLAEYLGLVLTPGVAVDPTSSQNGIDPRTVIGRQYTEHAITKEFTLLTAFPEARAAIAIATNSRRSSIGTSSQR